MIDLESLTKEQQEYLEHRAAQSAAYAKVETMMELLKDCGENDGDLALAMAAVLFQQWVEAENEGNELKVQAARNAVAGLRRAFETCPAEATKMRDIVARIYELSDTPGYERLYDRNLQLALEHVLSMHKRAESERQDETH